jgi:predicted Zn-dependent peptidase
MSLCHRWSGALVALSLYAVVTAPQGDLLAQGKSSPAKGSLNVPIEYYKLPNGLKVVLSPDATTPTVVVAVYYNIGFRIEPRDRTGFAHLFEHLMFQGSRNLGKMEFIRLVESNGGVLNGSTRSDFTNYFEVVPSNALQRMLWAEADRMRGLAIDSTNLDNQRDVVKNEVRVNVLNQPYGGFPWIDLPMRANSNWFNAHNFYGDLSDLDAATLQDAATFFKTYYAPNNAALVVTGDFDPKDAKRWVESSFGSRRSRTSPSRSSRRRSANRAPTLWPPARRSASPTMCRRATRQSGTPSGCSTRYSARDATAASIRRWFRSARSPAMSALA